MCDSQRLHDALVVFVGEAALQLQGAVFCHGFVFCCVQGVRVARLWHLSLRTMLIALVTTSGDGVIACRCSSVLVATDFA